MAKIIELEIKNFRGIYNKKFKFDDKKSIICLVGRGDSCKTSLLESIKYLLFPHWNLQLSDEDFYNQDVNNPIEITTRILLTSELEKKHFLKEPTCFFLGTIKNGRCEDNIEENDCEEYVLSAKLKIEKDLEPKWTIIKLKKRDELDIIEEEIDFKVKDRRILSCHYVSDYVDQHLSFNSNSPLDRYIRNSSEQQRKPYKIFDDIRELEILKTDFAKNDSEISKTLDLLQQKSSGIGIKTNNLSVKIEISNLFSTRETKLSLHEDSSCENQSLPLKLRGKGSKRLISIATQMLNFKDGGLLLIDEIEQALEPDRVKQLVKSLKEEAENNNSQVFITTHSRDVIVELGSKYLYLLLKDDEDMEYKNLDIESETLKGLVRSCPEAFFAKKIIVCEGATEVGVLRALDSYRKKSGKKIMSFEDCAYIDGRGDNEAINKSTELKNCGLKIAILCDNDTNQAFNKGLENLRNLRVEIIQCENEKSIENQIIDILSEEAKNKITEKVISLKGRDSLMDSLQASSNDLGLAIKKGKYLKSVGGGEFLGNILFEEFDSLEKDLHTVKMFTKLDEWIENK
jgi:AAA15 family ATPase/GTPase